MIAHQKPYVIYIKIMFCVLTLDSHFIFHFQKYLAAKTEGTVCIYQRIVLGCTKPKADLSSMVHTQFKL